MVERSRVRVPAGVGGKFLLRGQLSVLTLVSVPHPCYCSSTFKKKKITAIVPKRAGGRLQPNTHTYVALNGRLQLNTHTYVALNGRLQLNTHTYVALNKVADSMVYTELVETAAVPGGTSYVPNIAVSTPLQ